MAVEKMAMMNMVAHQDDMNKILRQVVMLGNIHVVDALDQIDDTNFTISMLEENLKEIENICHIEAYQHEDHYADIQEKLNHLMKLMAIDRKIIEKELRIDFKFKFMKMEVDKIYHEFVDLHERIDAYEEELSKLNKITIFKSLESMDVDLKKLVEMKNFEVKIGALTNENRLKLQMNYENISAAVMHIEADYEKDLYLIVSPRSLAKETNRILRSVRFEEMKIDSEYLGVPKDMFETVQKRIYEINYELSELKKIAESYRNQYEDDILRCYSLLSLDMSASKLKKSLACSQNYFYLSGWVAMGEKESIVESLESIAYNVILNFKEEKQLTSGEMPPTRLKNHWLLSPFEMLVNMYGTPSYNEADPTVFIGLTYMILFGAMFGDMGQGLLFILAGYWISKKQAIAGGIAKRIGLSSMIFGFFYDSIFGYEHVISHGFESVLGPAIADKIFIRPIENINTILASAVILGIVLLFLSFAYSISNKMRVGDIQEGLLGRNGLNGLILYIALLLLAGNAFDILKAPTGVLTFIVVISIVVLIIREPLANKIKGRDKLYHESASEYYVESGFELLETFMSMLSNSVSFVRVGAFALNHVGLFIAFHTMAEMIGGIAGGVSMFIVGNLVVIALEGLIVFIQGLRLVYYELFSKYFVGEGRDFIPSIVEEI